MIVKRANIGYPTRKLQLSQALFHDEGNHRRDVKQEVEVLAGSFAAFPAECRSKKWFKGNGSDDDDELDDGTGLVSLATGVAGGERRDRERRGEREAGPGTGARERDGMCTQWLESRKRMWRAHSSTATTKRGEDGSEEGKIWEEDEWEAGNT
ncbi:hypothetical protein FIBSPDRAFT_889033 [Athelia psychrophila]|uniref:Uncharacterized protein n=1 Tax=Athelia psychrophila TaxID=1759441 RepID=A0A166MJ81_9AGAM|nr:hypothetical protein FIBSPDRAFT_889033 [Fibularhizoctonia sp. CBS 109695]